MSRPEVVAEDGDEELSVGLAFNSSPSRTELKQAWTKWCIREVEGKMWLRCE